jgi:ribosomal protein S18 acetylase RimI-like enzyme
MIHASEAIFAVSDVRETVKFYREVLGFESEWFWEDPPTFGGVQWGRIGLMFCLQPKMQGKTDGLMHFFRVDDVRGLYERHKAAGAPIFSELENKPWGLAEYVVLDPNGYHLRFAGPEIYERRKTATEVLPSHIRIEKRTPTYEDFARLKQSVGWSVHEESLRQALERSLFFISAIDARGGHVVGLTRASGEGNSYTIWDVMVQPEYQHQKIGSALMEMAIAELRKIGPRGSFVGLFTPKPHFYERLGFVKDIGMHMAL